MKNNKEELITLARKAIECYLKNEELEIDDSIKKRYSKKQGCFVTLKKNNKLRGCIGFPYPNLELWKAIIESAKAAATEDPRFPSLTLDELEKIKIEVSILTVPEEIKTEGEEITEEELIKKIKLGVHGLIVQNKFYSGLLLPQVATEFNLSEIEFLSETCLKAGLTYDSWKDKNTRILRFEAEIIQEK